MKGFVLRQARRSPVIGRIWDEYDQARAQREDALARRDDAVAAEQAMRAERDAAIAGRDHAVIAEQAMRAERDTAIVRCDDAVAAEQATAAERDAAIAERDHAIAVEQAMRVARDAAIAERDHAADAGQAMGAECDAAFAERDTARLRLHELLQPARSESLPTAICDRLHRSAELKPGAPRKAVIVPVQGVASQRESAVTQPFFENYCQKIGVDLRIIDMPCEIPNVLIKVTLLPFVHEYDRVAIIDADVIIREGCPDLFSLVPDDRIGAIMEGRWTDRHQTWAEIAELYGLGTTPVAERYIDTGVMVISKRFFPLFETLAQQPQVGYPKDENSLINVTLYYNDVHIHEIPRDFNWIPYSPADFDWRWAWIVHMADYWPRPPKQDHAWRASSYGEGRYYSRVPLSAPSCRLSCLIEIAAQLRGEDVRLFHPADMDYNPPSARILLTADGTAVMSCRPTAREGPLIYGPYAALRAGRWSVTLLGPDGRTTADADIIADMVYKIGRQTLRSPAPIGIGATFEVYVPEDVGDVEVRMYACSHDYVVGCILIRAIAGDGEGISDVV